MKSLLRLFAYVTCVLALVSAQSNVNCPRPDLVVGDATVWGKIWQKPNLSLMATWSSLPYFSDFVNIVNTAGSNITLLAPDNNGVLKTLERVIMYVDKKSKLSPDDDKLSNFLNTLRLGYGQHLSFISDLDKAFPGGTNIVINDIESLRAHHDRICTGFTSLVDLWQNQIQPSNTFVKKLVANLMYHLIPGTIMSNDIGIGSSFVPSMLTDTNFVQIGEGVSQKLHFLKYIKPSDQSASIMINLFNHPDKLLSCKVVEADTIATNGAIHVVDTILGYPRSSTKMMKIWKLDRFRTATKVAGLEDNLNSNIGVTLFVPGNFALDKFAFKSLPVESFFSGKSGSFVESEWLNNVDASSLRQVLPAHIVQGIYYSNDLKNLGGQCLTNMVNNSLCVTYVGGSGVSEGLKVGNAQVIIPNILMKNGVMHIIDQVLIESPTQQPASTNVNALTGSWRFGRTEALTQRYATPRGFGHGYGAGTNTYMMHGPSSTYSYRWSD